MNKLIIIVLCLMLAGAVLFTSGLETRYSFSPRDFKKSVTETLIVCSFLRIPYSHKECSRPRPAVRRFYDENPSLPPVLDGNSDTKCKLVTLTGYGYFCGKKMPLTGFDADIAMYYYLAGEKASVREKLLEICNKLGSDATYSIAAAEREFSQYANENMEMILE